MLLERYVSYPPTNHLPCSSCRALLRGVPYPASTYGHVWLSCTHLGAFDEGEAAGLAGDDGDRALNLGEAVPCVVLHQVADEGGLAHPWRPVYQHHKGRRLL